MNGLVKMRNKISSYIKSWKRRGYPDDIPDEAPRRLEESFRVPSYRMLCIAIMKNDRHLLILGYSRPPCSIYNEIKRKELTEKGKIIPNPQKRLF